MTLVTRCPSCNTTFRVQPGQLSSRGGKVRCGKCAAVFDGVTGLVEQEPVSPSFEPSPQLGLFDPSRRSAQAQDEPTSTRERGGATAELPAPAPAGRAKWKPRIRPAEPEEEFEPEFLLEEPERRFGLLWGFLALLALATLLIQAALHFRTDLALHVPETRPYLAAACELADCELHLPRRPEMMSIESSDLHADPGREKAIVLNAVIRNRAPYPQDYPALELTLTDENDRPVLRRVLMPENYMGVSRARALLPEGIAPGAESVLNLRFDSSLVQATGYRLYLFYP